MTSDIKIAFTRDWMTSYGGSELQLDLLHQMFPKAPIYTTVYDQSRLPQFAQADIRTMKLPNWLARGRYFEKLIFLMPRYFRSLDLSQYQVVVSITSGFSKGLNLKGDTHHLSICNTPLRFAWGYGGENRGLMSKIFAPYFRWIDKNGAKSVDVFYANSNNVAKRVKQAYDRGSRVTYPPVHVERYQDVVRVKKPEGFITMSRLVSYKKIDLIVQACKELNVPLTIIGEGPERENLEKIAGTNTRFLGFCSEEVIKEELSKAKAFLFAGEEDFGIVPVEAIAAGCPVIAYRKGGALETVVDGVTGVFFQPQTVTALKMAIAQFNLKTPSKEMREHVQKFSAQRFRDEMSKAINEAVSPDFKRL